MNSLFITWCQPLQLEYLPQLQNSVRPDSSSHSDYFEYWEIDLNSRHTMPRPLPVHLLSHHFIHFPSLFFFHFYIWHNFNDYVQSTTTSLLIHLFMSFQIVPTNVKIIFLSLLTSLYMYEILFRSFVRSDIEIASMTMSFKLLRRLN